MSQAHPDYEASRASIGTDNPQAIATYLLGGRTEDTYGPELVIGSTVQVRPWVFAGDGIWMVSGEGTVPATVTDIYSYSLDRDYVDLDISGVPSGYATWDGAEGGYPG